jgi:hypothetical protein
MRHKAIQEQLDIGGHRFVMGTMHRHTEDVMQETMMDDHSDEGTGGEQRVDFAEAAFGDSHLNVGRKMVIEDAVMLGEKHLG